MIKNQDVYAKNPASTKLVNEGVSNVNDDASEMAMAVLRYELETFVCDGQYQSGMERILETFLKNLDQKQQPGVWVSGFFGSGKSHFVKMLRALWTDTPFEDGATARGLTDLPETVQAHFRELSIAGKRFGGLHAVSGTLGSSAEGSVRLALMELIFRSVGLPAQYNLAEFVLWLRDEELEDPVKDYLEANNYDWNEELDNLLVAEGIREALIQLKPNLFSNVQICNEILLDRFKSRGDISRDEMVKTIKRTLSRDGRFPLTLVALDEVQQFIGQNEDRSIAVQELVESCQRDFSSSLMFIGTGQTAVTGTHNLKKLEGRFTLRIELSENDVDSVIRKVILAKKPEMIEPIHSMMVKNDGEITRHLHGSSIAHKEHDRDVYTQDYPVLPVRRRFWEHALKVLDNTGTESQLRNQLSTIHKLTQVTMDKPLGHFAGGDFIYFDNQESLLQTGMVPKKVYQYIQQRAHGTEQDQLLSKAVAVVFLINKLQQRRSELGIRATVDSVADLLVENIVEGSAGIRSKLPKLLDECEMLFKGEGGEYRIQTEESSAWNDEFRNQRSRLGNSSHALDAERDVRIRQKWSELFRKSDQISHGQSKVSRQFRAEFGGDPPKPDPKVVTIWVRTGWEIDEASVIAEAKQSGFESSMIYVHIPRQSADVLRGALMDVKASAATLEIKGIPATAEGNEAKASMETTRQVAEEKIRTLLEDLFSSAKVIQSGGNELQGVDLPSKVKEAVSVSLKRLYPRFNLADDAKWASVYRKASSGAPDALADLKYFGPVADQPVCKAVLESLGAGKKGLEIREQFESAPYGWPRDAVDGALQVLLVNGLIRAFDDRSGMLDPTKLDRNAIGKLTFRAESVVISTEVRLAIRRLFTLVEVRHNPKDDASSVPEFLTKLETLARSAGGEAPRPKTPSLEEVEQIRRLVGNEQLSLIYSMRESIGKWVNEWKETAHAIQERLPHWVQLKAISEHLQDQHGMEMVMSRIETIEGNRQLLHEPDLITPLLKELTDLARQELNRLKQEYTSALEKGEDKLKADENWLALTPEEKMRLRSGHSLLEQHHPSIDVSSAELILHTLQRSSLSSIKDRTSALPTRFERVLIEAGRLSEPTAQVGQLPRRMLKSEEDLSHWLKETEAQLQQQLKAGPVIIR